MVRDLNVIVGLGVTGWSCARYLHKKGLPFAITDSRPNPPNLTELKNTFPNVPIATGAFDEKLLNQAEQLIVSPGISLKEPAIAQQIAQGVPVVGDIELFVRTAEAPIIAITGTNAKSTVTTLVGEMAKAAGKKVQVGGNLGVPALDLLTDISPELYVLELSSFQLDTTFSLKPAVATVLNVTQDHMDRYATLEEYSFSKQHVYSQCKVAVCNRDDALTICHEKNINRILHFTLNAPRENEFGLILKNKKEFLAFQNEILLAADELPILGRHYQANALAALAIGYGYGLPFEPMINTLKSFNGLPHRCQLVREHNGVRWYNDSKGTNVGATLAAIEGLGKVIRGKLVLIAGGLGKNADFSPLIPAIAKYVKTAVLIGEAAPLLANLIGTQAQVVFAKDMAEAVKTSEQLATAGDSVLLSPACASYDMFKNFEHRGEVFVECVNKL